jgi:hypothetical protein
VSGADVHSESSTQVEQFPTMVGKLKTQIVCDACMHQVLQPNLIIVFGGKKAS